MTDRHAAYIVVMDDDIRDDETAHILNALRMVSGVISVEPVVSNYEFVVARSRRDSAWQDALLELARNPPGKPGRT